MPLIPYFDEQGVAVYNVDCLDLLRSLQTDSIDCCVTSPPYWGLRDYGVTGQIGLEGSLQEYISKITEVFREARRVVKGTLWLNLGDSYAGHNLPGWRPGNEQKNGGASNKNGIGYVDGLNPKNLVGVPWRVAFALQADGWYLRSDIIWHKPQPMPESVSDRPTRAHEYLFLMAKAEKYYYDAAAISEPCSPDTHARMGRAQSAYAPPGQHEHRGLLAGRANGVNPKAAAADRQGVRPKQNASWSAAMAGTSIERRNKRTVWTINVEGSPDAHFATFPEGLVEPCIKAGSPAGGTILDPFTGSGTTALVARRLGCRFVGSELNPDYCAIAARRLAQNVLDFA